MVEVQGRLDGCPHVDPSLDPARHSFKKKISLYEGHIPTLRPWVASDGRLSLLIRTQLPICPLSHELVPQDQVTVPE